MKTTVVTYPRFIFQNACKVHMRTHTDALPYECTFCPKVFRERGSLERHLRTHTGEKPYQCTYCGRSFAEHGTLSRHLKAKGRACYWMSVICSLHTIASLSFI